MTWMVSDLKHRIQIGQGIQVPNASGGFTFSFSPILTCWSSMKPVSEYIKAVRGVNAQTGLGATHKFRVRLSSVNNIGKQFTKDFATSYKVNADLAQVKANWFIKLLSPAAPVGRLFRVDGIDRDDDFSEWVDIAAHEMLETGVGRNPI